MVNTQLWMFISSNLLVFALGASLTWLSYKAQRRLDEPNLRFTTLGFALITVSTVVEAFYTPGVAGGNWLDAAPILLLYTIEYLLIAGGLGCIAYSLLRY